MFEVFVFFPDRSKYIPPPACPGLISADSRGRAHTYRAHGRPCPGGRGPSRARSGAHVPTTLCRRLLLSSFFSFFFSPRHISTSSSSGVLLLRRQVIQSPTKRIRTNKSPTSKTNSCFFKLSSFHFVITSVPVECVVFLFFLHLCATTAGLSTDPEIFDWNGVGKTSNPTGRLTDGAA